MKTVKFTVQERLSIPQFLNTCYLKGGMSLQMLTDAQNITRKLAMEIEFNQKPEKNGEYKAIRGEEAKKVNLRQGFNFEGGMRTSQLYWDAQKDKGKDVELSDDEAKLLCDIIERKNSEKSFTLADGYILGLAEKLGLELTKKEEVKK